MALIEDPGHGRYAAYTSFSRREWAGLRRNTPLTLSDEDLAQLRGLNEQLSLDEVEEVYLPLSRLLNLHIAAARGLGRVKDAFMGSAAGAPPYIVAIAGSVAVGKSTTARVLQALLARWPDHPSVALVTTDGFLYPNAVLIERGLMSRKGFPESYDLKRMVEFLSAVKAGAPVVAAPVYSHFAYDIVPDQMEHIRQPDVLIFEGLNVLQTPIGAPALISDFFDFSIYIDADEDDIAEWYLERFSILQRSAFQNPNSFFHHYKDLALDEAREVALGYWRDINSVNLRENILPTRERADLVLHKGANHSIDKIRLRRM